MSSIFRYNNGLRAVHTYMESVRSVTIGVFVKTGSVNEDEANNGISHLVEHMLFKGTKKRSAFQIADDIDVIGAQINAFTSKSTTCYYTVSTFDKADECMEILSDIFFESVFDEGELEKEKSVILEEICMVDDTPDESVMELVVGGYYKGHPLARPILGTKDTVMSFTPDDMRGYMKRFYTADNVVVSIAGHIKEEAADALIRRYFESRFETGKAEIREIKRHIAKPASLFKTKDIEQANLAIALPCVEFNHRLEMAAYAFNNVFGGGMSSRLFQTIREKAGLVYSVYSYVSTYADDGMLTIYLACNPDQAKAAARMVFQVTDEFLADGINDREFLSGKAQLKGGLVLGQESSAAIMKINAKYLQGADILFDFDKLIAETEAISKDDIMSVARYAFDYGKMSTAYLGKGKKRNIFK